MGWVFRDRRRFLRGFPEPPPPRPELDTKLVRRWQHAENTLRDRVTLAIAWGFGGSLLVAVAGGVPIVLLRGEWPAAVAVSVAPLLLGLAATWFLVASCRRVRQAVNRQRAAVVATYVDARDAWLQRRDAFDAVEQAEVDRLDEWGAASVPRGTRRFDVFGGTLWGWEGLLTVFGASMLVERRPVTVLDLSRELVSAELAGLSEQSGATVRAHRLPTELAHSDLLAGVGPAELVDLLVESMHFGTTADRAERSTDHRLLRAVCAALGEDVSVRRLVAAIRVLMREPSEPSEPGEPGGAEVLRPHEREHIADELFSDEYRRDALPHLRRIESYLYPLRNLGAAWVPSDPADLTCVAVEPGTRTAGSELLTDLLVHWLVNRVTAGAHPPGSVVFVVGADELPAVHLDRLADACARRGVRLVNIFRRLREEALRAIGGGAVGFMRLGNPEEAAVAADFVGREHRFVVSQLTRGVSGGDSRSEGDSYSRDWTRTVQVAQQIGWNEAESSQRVYEYTVEPTTFQGLPDHALLLVEHTARGPAVKAVECNPGLVLLPGVSTEPLPPQPRETLVVPTQRAAPGRRDAPALRGDERQRDGQDEERLQLEALRAPLGAEGAPLRAEGAPRRAEGAPPRAEGVPRRTRGAPPRAEAPREEGVGRAFVR
ncbi:MAG TPA: hypothetical protein VFB84_08035 [Micromonosporaceae bacterium]|nr:hypothetical protein [Micromonosporaceae bacterium]